MFGIYVVVVLLAAALAVAAARAPLGPRKAHLKFVASALLGLCFVVYGAVRAVLVKLSPRVTVTGTVSALTQTHGRGSSSTFNVVSDQGHIAALRSDYAGPNLIEGEHVTATYVGRFGTVTELTPLDGPGPRMHLHEGDGTSSALLAVVLGAVILFNARKSKADRPDGSPPPGRWSWF